MKHKSKASIPIAKSLNDSLTSQKLVKEYVCPIAEKRKLNEDL